MTRDLTATFVTALNRKVGWESEEVATELRALSIKIGARFEWGRDEGEHWMHVEGAGGDLLALVWTVAPFAVCGTIALPLLGTLMERYGALVEVVDDWEAPLFAIDPAGVEAAGARRFWRAGPDEISVSSFSALDLLAATE